MSEVNKGNGSAASGGKTGNKGKLAIRIGAALLLVAVVAGIIFPVLASKSQSPVKEGRTVMTVNGHEVSAEEFEYFLSNDILEHAYYYGGDYFADQKNFDAIVDYVSQEITFYYAFLDWAEENGYGLTEEQKEHVRAHMEEDKATFDSPEQYEDYLKSIYVTEDLLLQTEYMFECLNNYYDHLLDPVDGPYAESAENLSKEADTFKIYGAKHILILTGQTDRTDDESKDLAEDILKRIESGEDFDALMNEYSEDPGLEGYPEGYTFTEGEFVDAFYDAVVAMKIGEHSGLVQTDYGYHIIQRIEPDHDETVAKIIEQLYGAEVDSLVAAAKVEKSKGFDRIAYSDFRISADYPPGASGDDGSDDGGETDNADDQ